MGRLLPFVLLVAASLPASEIPLAPIVTAPAATSSSPRIASNGDGFLAVWTDYRAGGEIRGARLDANGSLLDPFGFRIFDVGGEVSVASDGRDYMVATIYNCAATVVRVSAAGQVSAPHQIGSAQGCAPSAGIASNGSSYLVAWGPAVLIDLEGNAIQEQFPTGFQWQVGVASNGSNYLITGFFGATLFSVGGAGTISVSARGEAGTAHPIAAGNGLTAASDGTNYLIVTTGSGGVATLVAAPDGTPIGSVKTLASTNAVSSPPRAAWNGSDYVVAYTQRKAPGTPDTVYIEHANAEGSATSAGTPITEVAESSNIPAFDLAGRDGVTVFAGGTLSGVIIGGVLPGLLPLSFDGATQSRPELTATSDGAVAVWREYQSNSGIRVRGVSLDAGGRPRGDVVDIGETDFEIVTAPHVAFDGTRVIITWTLNGSIFARRFSPLMQPIDPMPLTIGTTRGEYGLSAGNGVALVVFVPDDRFQLPDLLGAVIAADASIRGFTVAATSDFIPFGPVAAWNGSEFLVAWAHPLGPPPLQAIFPDPPDEILAARISADGTVIDTTPATVAKPDITLGTIALASNGTDFYAAWLPFAYGVFSAPPYVAGKAIGANGVAAANADVLSLSDVVSGPSIARYGDSYVIGWIAADPDDGNRIELRVLGSSGLTVLRPFGSEGTTDGVSLTALASTIAAGYSRISDDAGGVRRAFVDTTTAPRPRRRGATSATPR